MTGLAMGTARTRHGLSGESDEARWAAVMARDARADGTFYYSVSTTGVFCRPSCGARRPKREHVRFHLTAGDARRAGFRACRRCRPEGPSLEQERTALVSSICREIEASDRTPRLDRLAARAGLSPWHFHRVFRVVTGVTPRAYAEAHRRKRVRATLTSNRTVTDAIYDAGFNSGGHFYAGADAALGMTPSQFKAGGEGTTIEFATGRCSLGVVLVARSARGICAVLLGDDAASLTRDLRGRFPRATLTSQGDSFKQQLAGTIACIESPSRRFDLPLDVRGTVFQQRVWRALREIPCGATATYQEIATALGQPRAARAVASACAANPVAVVIPCHRVVRADGSLSGYRWGIDRKRRLLDREGKASGRPVDSGSPRSTCR